MVVSGQTSTSRYCREPASQRTTMPPPPPAPEALDQTMFASVGSGVAKPLSPPPTVCQALRGMPWTKSPLMRLFEGPRADGPS